MEEFTLRETKEGAIHGYQWPVPDPKKVICIVHGIGEHGGRYDRVASKFNEGGYAVFSMDLRGHGKSLGKRGDCAPRDEVLEDVSALISIASRTFPKKAVIVYGHSMGGNITLDYRRRGAFRDLPAAYLLSAPWVRLVRHIPVPVFRIAKAISVIAPKLSVGSNVDEMNLGNPASIMPYHEDPLIHNHITLRCAIEGLQIADELEKGVPHEGSKPDPKGDERIKSIPTLIMHGGADRICDIEGSRKVFENCLKRGENVELKELPGIFHEIHNGGHESCGDEVIDMMTEFFDSIS